MDEAKFWQIIEASADDNRDRQCEKLAAQLQRLDQDDLIAFDREYRLRLNKAYHWDLWAAAYTINGGCSDDKFDYFCDWLIAQGESVFYTALQNAESLALVAKQDEIDFEEFRYVMGEIYTDRFGGDIPSDPDTRRPAEPTGTPFDESEEALRSAYPGLYKTYWEDGNAAPIESNTAETSATQRASDIWADDKSSRTTGQKQPEPRAEDLNPFLPQTSSSYRNRSGLALFGMGIVIFIGVSVVSSFFGGSNKTERGPSQISLSTDSPLYFARLCELRVKWWDQDRIPSDGVGDVSAQSYQRVRSVKPVNIRKDIDGRIRWDVVIKTSTDRFNCSDYADNYGGEIGRKNNPVLEKIRE